MSRKKMTVYDYLKCKGKRQLSVMFVHNAEEAAAAEVKKQEEIDNRIQNNNVPGGYQVFGNDAFSSTFDRRFGSNSLGSNWTITGSNRNPSSLIGDFSIIDYLNTGFNKTPKEKTTFGTTGGMLQKGKPVSNKRPFISHTESVTAGKSIGSLMKKFK